MSCCSKEEKNSKVTNFSNIQIINNPASCCATSEEETSSCCSTNDKKVDVEVNNSSEPINSSCCSTTEETSCSSEHVKSKVVVDNKSSKGEEIQYRIQGMDCPSCAQTIEKGLQRLKSVINAKVSYNSEKLQLVVDGTYSAVQINSVVQNLGFTIEPVHQNRNIHTYDVDGMDCGGCAKSIENHLIQLTGVDDAHVNFSTGKMEVAHSITVDEVIKEVSKIGFQASIHGEDNKSDIKSQNRRSLGLIALSGTLIATGFIGSYIGLSSFISIILFATAIVISGYKPVKSAYYAVKSRSLDMNVLMSSAAIGAAIIGEWFEGATVVWLFSLGIYLQNRSMDQTRKSIRNLMDLAPSMAWLQLGDELVQKPVEDISVGDTIVIKPGDKIPLDGTIMQGESSINQAPITGESLPVDKEIGDIVFAGTINESGSLDVEVTKLVEDSTLSKIIHLVEEAQDQKAPTEAFIDKFASIYTPIVFLLALSVIVIPPTFGFGSWGEWTYKGLALLVVACPCALVISTPVAIVSAIGNAARNGVLIKGGTFLEAAGQINAIAFDKTGTLTEGKPKVTEMHPVNISEEALLSIAQTLESRSTHPIAKTLVSYAQEKGIPFVNGSSYNNIVGKGVQATIDGTHYYAGNPRLFADKNISLGGQESTIRNMEQQGKTTVLIGNDQEILGIIAVADSIRSTTADALRALPTVGINEVVMLTGDNHRTADSIAGQAGVNRYFAELLPEDKVKALTKIQKEGNKVAMVGDGINDAPALATADIGIAMGVAGTDTAMETADIVLMADNLEKLPYTVRLSRKALTIIKQNIWFSLIIKFIALGLIFPGWLTLWMAVLSDSGAAIIVILNALRLLRVKH